MAKFFGKIGFVDTVETKPGVWRETVTEREYYGDIIRNSRRIQASQDSTNKNITINNEISILADPYAQENMYAMRYVEFMGAKWEVSSVEVEYPRLKLSVGGVYNAE